MYLQSREALCRATEKEVSPPCSSPSRGAGEMLEHSRYPQWMSLEHGDATKRHREQNAREDSVTERIHSLFVTLDPGVLVLPTVAFLGAFNVQLLVTELVGRRCL